MAKFFSRKDKDKQHLTHSQVVGIIWISILLLLFVAITFFMKNCNGSTQEITDSAPSEMSILTQKDDSVYQQRRHYNATHYNKTSWSDKRQLTNKAYKNAYDSIHPVRKQPLTVELNSADTTTLQLLYGIGAKRAHRIAAYRERLGGFYRVEQLLEVYSITPELLADIAPHLTIDTTEIRKIDINSIELKQLIKHPYIEYYQARDIIRLRGMGQRFTTVDDLKAVPSMADSTLDRLLPYIDF